MRATAVLALLALLVASASASAQGAPRDADAWRALTSALAPGSLVTVRTKDGTRVRGTLVQQVDDGILVKPKTRLPSPMRSISFDDIEELERAKHGMSPGTKVVLGTGIGVGVMMLVGALIVLAAGY
jgi:hypothetical protein